VQILEKPVLQPMLETDPMFDTPQLFNSGTGAQVFLTTADLEVDDPKKTRKMAAPLHIWS
jgi:hypothetical protein